MISMAVPRYISYLFLIRSRLHVAILSAILVVPVYFDGMVSLGVDLDSIVFSSRMLLDDYCSSDYTASPSACQVTM